MSRSVLATASFLLALVLLGGGLIWPGGPARAATTNVDVKSNFFNPANVTVNTGDTVTWTNTSFGFHTTTSRTGLWDHELSPGDAFSFTFTQAGVYNYYCQIHEFSGM